MCSQHFDTRDIVKTWSRINKDNKGSKRGPSERDQESRSFKAISDDTRELFVGNLRSHSSLTFLFPLREMIRFSCSLGPLGTSCGLNIVGSAPFTTFFYPTQGRNLRNLSVLYKLARPTDAYIVCRFVDHLIM